MRKDFIVKAGSYGKNLYIILDGEALVFGINNDLIGIMKSGTHFNNEMGSSAKENFNGKRIVHIVAKSLTVVGVLRKKDFEIISEAYPYWHQIIIRLNRSIHNKAKKSLEKYSNAIGEDESYSK